MQEQQDLGPSGLFPTGPPRPRYREPHPIRAGALLTGLAAAAAWLLSFSLLGGGELAGYAWWTLVAGAGAWLVALALARYGDRGVAVGVAAATGVDWSVVATVVVLEWTASGDWPMW